MKGITVKYYEIDEPIDDKITGGPNQSSYEGILDITKKFIRELTREETPGKIGYKVYYDKDGLIEKMKQFDKKGNFISSKSDIQETRSEIEKILQMPVQEEQVKEGYYYSRSVYHYNKKGKLVREEGYDENNKIESKYLYYYDKNERLKRVVEFDYFETTTKEVVEFSYTKEGILIKADRFKNDELERYTRMHFSDNKRKAITYIYDKDHCLIRADELKKVCDLPVQCDLQNQYFSSFDIPLMKKGYRFSKEKLFDIDGEVKEERYYYHNKAGNLITEHFYEQCVLGLSFSRFYVYQLNKNQLQKKSRYTAEKVKGNFITTLFSEEDYLYDRERKLIKITTNQPVDKNNFEKLYKYDKQGQLIETFDTETQERIITMYDEAGRDIREETHLPDEPSPFDFSTYTYDKEGKLIESEFSLFIKLPK